MFVYLFVGCRVCLFVCFWFVFSLFGRLFESLVTSLLVTLFVYLFVCLSLCLIVSLFVCLFVCLLVCLFNCLLVHWFDVSVDPNCMYHAILYQLESNGSCSANVTEICFPQFAVYLYNENKIHSQT